MRTPRMPEVASRISSPLHRLDARVKLVLTLALMIAVFVIDRFSGLVLYALALAVLYAIARVPVRTALKTAAPLLVVALITALCNLLFVHEGEVIADWGLLVITTGGCRSALFYALRLAELVFMACLLMLTTPVVAITQATESLLAPLVHIGVPVRELSMMTGIALAFLPEFAHEADTVRAAQLSRCARFDQGGLRRRARALAAVLHPLMRRAFAKSENLALAMESRCYRGGAARSHLHASSLGAAEGVASAAAIAFIVALVLFCR